MCNSCAESQSESGPGEARTRREAVPVTVLRVAMSLIGYTRATWAICDFFFR
jgi:hypothetical protein